VVTDTEQQVLWTYAQDIASAYPDDQVDEYQDAALTLRHPYWDWALYPALPDVVTQTQLSINTPQGLQTVDNPLFAYNFQSDAAGNGFPAADPVCSRLSCPAPKLSLTGVPDGQFLDNGPMVGGTDTVKQSKRRHCSINGKCSYVSGKEDAGRALVPDDLLCRILSLTYQLLTAVSNYTTFSCTWPGGQTGIANNIEGIHNSIHNSVGGFGHMAFPETAGFDPVFWLHHAMVDRLVAMWQVLYPDSFIAPTVNEYGTYYEPVGTIDSETSGKCDVRCQSLEIDVSQFSPPSIPMLVAVTCSPRTVCAVSRRSAIAIQN
jgi:tyrosinase